MRDDVTDQQLLDAAAAGDKAAFDALFERYRDWVYALACRFVDRETAADVVQETFVYLLRKLAAGQGGPGGGVRLTAKMTTFLYPVVKNSALAIKRKQRRYVGPDEGLLEFLPAPGGGGAGSGGGGVGAGLDGSESLAKLLEAVRRLPVGQQEVLLMRVVDEMSVAEVAVALGIPEGTVKSRLSLALGGLRGDERLGDLLLRL